MPPYSTWSALRPNDPPESWTAAARILRAALGVDRQRAAQRVESEHRVRAGNQLDAGDRRLRQQVPVDDVAERLVDAHAVLEHRQALGHAEQRRGREPAKVDVRLEGFPWAALTLTLFALGWRKSVSSTGAAGRSRCGRRSGRWRERPSMGYRGRAAASCRSPRRAAARTLRRDCRQAVRTVRSGRRTCPDRGERRLFRRVSSASQGGDFYSGNASRVGGRRFQIDARILRIPHVQSPARARFAAR